MGEELEAQSATVVEAGAVRPVPQPTEAAALQPWPREVGTVALAAAGGAAVGIAAVTAVRAARSSRRPGRRWGRRARERVIASRSFLIDVHVLGR